MPPAASWHSIAWPVQLAGCERSEHFLDLAGDPGLEPDARGGKHLREWPGHGTAHEEIQMERGDTSGPEGEATEFQRHFLACFGGVGLGVHNDDPLSGVEDG